MKRKFGMIGEVFTMAVALDINEAFIRCVFHLLCVGIQSCMIYILNGSEIIMFGENCRYEYVYLLPVVGQSCFARRLRPLTSSPSLCQTDV